MCGITGCIQSGGAVRDLSELCGRMTDAIAHRGPDAYGVWVDPQYPLALGHRRLSIIDLSEAGAQPMLSATGRYVLSFNGEIYNFSRLRKELSDSRYPYKGHSDTEVILAAVEHLGSRAAISRLEGMFAIALCSGSLSGSKRIVILNRRESISSRESMIRPRCSRRESR